MITSERERERTFIDSDTILHSADAEGGNNSLCTIIYYKLSTVCVILLVAVTLYHIEPLELIHLAAFLFISLCIAGIEESFSLSVCANFTAYFSKFLTPVGLAFSGNKSLNLSLFVHLSANLTASICLLSSFVILTFQGPGCSFDNHPLYI